MAQDKTTATAGGVTLADLHAANIARQVEWCPDQLPDLSFRGNELAGETGEACNVIKKLERERQGWRGSRATLGQLAEELADVVICADLCAVTAGIDLDAAVRDKFNATSEKVGLTTKLAALAASSPPSSDGVGVAADALPEGVADRVVSVPHPHWTGQWMVGWLFSDREEGRDAVRSLAVRAAAPSAPTAVTQVLDWGVHDVQPNPFGKGRWCARCGVAETTCSLEGNLCRPLYAGAQPYGGRQPSFTVALAAAPSAPAAPRSADLPGREEITKWRDDALDKAAAIVRRYEPFADDAVRDILALKSPRGAGAGTRADGGGA